MSEDAPDRSAASFLIRYSVELLTILALLFVIHTGLLPFDFFEGSPSEGSREFFGVATSDFTTPDIVSNLFLYVPVGILLAWSLRRIVGYSVLALPLAVAFSAAMSASIEWLQAYSPTRVSSMIDLYCNVFGACIGAGISLVAQAIVPRIARAAIGEFQARPRTSLVKCYCGGLVLAATMPFSLSFDVGLVERSVRSANYVPFRSIATHRQAANDALAADDKVGYAHAKWSGLKRWSRWAAEFASFVVFVWLLQPVLRDEYRFHRRGSMLLVWWAGGALAGGLSVLQFPIVTRDFDSTDILFRLLGIAAGLVTGSIYMSESACRRRSNLHAPDGAPVRRLARLGFAGMAVYIVYVGVIPLTIDLEAGGVMRSIQSESFLPFFAYFVTRFDLMMDDVMEKFCSYALFGALLASCWLRLQRRDTWTRALSIAAVGAALSVPIEIVQMFIPVRVTSLTDPILAACGCVAGVIAQEHAVAFYHFARRHDERIPEQSPRGPEAGRSLSPTDELIATLTEPAADSRA